MLTMPTIPCTCEPLTGASKLTESYSQRKAQLLISAFLITEKLEYRRKRVQLHRWKYTGPQQSEKRPLLCKSHRYPHFLILKKKKSCILGTEAEQSKQYSAASVKAINVKRCFTHNNVSHIQSRNEDCHH